MSRNISMLIADDYHAIQQLLADAARASRLPLRLSITDNGRDCLTLLNGAHIDLAFIDVHMPELSGTEAFWSARKQGIKTFVTLMSTPPAAEAVEVAKKLQAYEFLFKPFALTDALGIIKTYARISAPTKVLVVDDFSSVRQLVQKIVQGSVFNCEVTEAGDGPTALTLCRTSEFDVAFLDQNMPGMSGLATMKRLMLVQPSLNFVMISAEHSATLENQALDCGACAYLHKPFNFAGRRPRAARRLRPAFAEPASERRRAQFRGGDRREHDPPGTQGERPHLRISVVRAAALPAQLRGPSGSRLHHRARQCRAGRQQAALLQLRSAHLLAA